VFFPPGLAKRLFDATREILAQLADPPRLAKMKRAIPARLDVPRMDDVPSIMTVDFAIVRDGESLGGRVVELQAFPSLFAFTLLQCEAWSEILADLPELRADWTCVEDRLDVPALLRRTILEDVPAEEVALVDITPERQKTIPDFNAVRKVVGIDYVDLSSIERDGRRLFRARDGKKIPIRRIFNRVVFDELERRNPPASFRFTDDLDVVWVPHPNWYWTWSKYSLPFLDHPAVPKATFLDELGEPPRDLEHYVLKPLFSYAGAGVKVDVTADDISSVPTEQRGGWVLQRKISYARDLVSPEGFGVAAEVRVLCLRPPGEKLRPVMNMIRLSRGKMLGIDFNRDLTWVGSSCGIWPR
jgi:hypothetical protein